MQHREKWYILLLCLRGMHWANASATDQGRAVQKFVGFRTFDKNHDCI